LSRHELTALGANEETDRRELSVVELFIRTFQMARKNYLRLLPIFVGFGVPAALLFTHISLATPTPNIPANFTTSSSPQLIGSVFSYVGYSLANYLVTWSILFFAAGLGIWKMYQGMGNVSSQDEPRSHVNYLNLAITTIITVIIIELGIFLVFIGALFFATMFYLVIASSVIEGRGPLNSLGRSRKLVSGRWKKTFLLMIGIQIIIYIVSALISGIVALFPLSDQATLLATNFTQEFVLALEFPLVSASMLVLYNSNRTSREIETQRPPSLYDNMRPQPMGNFPTTSKICSSCGTSLSLDEKFCHNCGAPQMPR
jgi:hypothetical protein